MSVEPTNARYKAAAPPEICGIDATEQTPAFNVDHAENEA